MSDEKTLTILQYEAIDLLARGFRQTEVCKTLKITPGTLKKWTSENELFRNTMHEEIKLRIGSYAPKAVNTIVRLMDARNEKVQLDASKEVLYMSGFKPATTSNVNLSGEVPVSEQTKELVNRAKKLIALEKENEITVKDCEGTE